MVNHYGFWYAKCKKFINIIFLNSTFLQYMMNTLNNIMDSPLNRRIFVIVKKYNSIDRF